MRDPGHLYETMYSHPLRLEFHVIVPKGSTHVTFSFSKAYKSFLCLFNHSVSLSLAFYDMTTEISTSFLGLPFLTSVATLQPVTSPCLRDDLGGLLCPDV